MSYWKVTVQCPAWIYDYLLPMLRPEEWAVVSYVVRKTWGFQRRSTRLSVARIAAGSDESGSRDRGVNLSKNTVRRILQQLRMYRVVIEEKPPIASLNLPSMIRIGWHTEIDWAALTRRRRQRTKVNRGRVGLDEQIEDVSLLFDDPDTSFEDFLATFHIEYESFFEEDNMSEYLPGLPNPRGERSRRAAEWLIFAKKHGVTEEEAHAMCDYLLSVTGRIALADQDTDLGDRALFQAHQAVMTLAGMGFESVAAVRELVETDWRESWMYRKAAADSQEEPLPAIGQLIDLASKRVAKREKQARKASTPTTAPAPNGAKPIRATMFDLLE